jgi:hypothetical protein
MDPETNLEKQLQLAQKILRYLDTGDDPRRVLTVVEEDAEKLAELVLALDEWLSQGGFRPSRWQRQQK